MHINSVSTAFASLALLAVANAHTVFTTLYVDGQNQGDGVCVRMDSDGSTVNSPIKGLQSPEMACGRNGETGVSRVCPVKAGSSLDLEFRVSAGKPESVPIDESHKGTCAVYMKKVESATASNNAAGDGWFKIWAEDYDEDAGKWCTIKLIENNGLLSATVPSDIQGGYYLLRAEILALHATQDSPPDPQFFVNCAQIYVESSGTAQPSTISIPENYVDVSMPAMTFNIYESPMALPYPMFGPEPYGSGDSEEDTTGLDDAEPDAEAEDECDTDDAVDAAYGDSQGADSTPDGQDEGLKPEDCILVNANWCGVEVPSYSDEDGCWDASDDCWDQSSTCFDEASPASWQNCEVWRTKCENIVSACKAGRFNGPPDAGKDLTPPAPDMTTSATRKLMAKVKRHESHIMRRAHRAHKA